jgi:hypothetical protein
LSNCQTRWMGRVCHQKHYVASCLIAPFWKDHNHLICQMLSIPWLEITKVDQGGGGRPATGPPPSNNSGLSHQWIFEIMSDSVISKYKLYLQGFALNSGLWASWKPTVVTKVRHIYNTLVPRPVQYSIIEYLIN